MAISETSERSRIPFARRALRTWMGVNGLTIATEVHRNISGNWDMLGNGFLGNSFGNIAPTEALTAGVHVGEEMLINRYHWPEKYARLVGLVTIIFANVAVESPALLFNLFNPGDTNAEFASDLIGGAIGFGLMKIPLMALRNMNQRRAR